MLVTYRLNPAFAVTNLSSSSTSGWRKKQNKQSSECNNSGRSATAKRILCFSQLTVNKCFTCWEAPPPKFCSLSHRALSVVPRGIAMPLWIWCQNLHSPPNRTAFQRGELQRLQVYALGCLTYFTMVSLKELQEAGLSASGAFYTPKAQVIPSPLQVLQVHAQVLNPQAAAFPHSGELCRSENNQKHDVAHWQFAQ